MGDGVVEARQDRMSLARAGIVLQVLQVGVAQRAWDAVAKRDTKEVRQPEVASSLAPLVVERRLVGRHETTPAIDELTELTGLLVGQRGDIGQNERLESAQMVGVQDPVVDHLERDSGLDQPPGTSFRAAWSSTFCLALGPP